MVILFKVAIYHFTAYVKPCLIPIFHSITDRSLYIRNEYIVTRYAPPNYAKLQIFLFPEIKINWRIFWQTNLSLGFNGYTSGRRYLCGKAVISKRTIQAKHSMRNYTFHIYHGVCQRGRLHIDTITKSHECSVFCCTAKLFIFTTGFHFTCGYEPSLLLQCVND